MTCSEAAALSHEAERERIREVARQMRARLGLAPDPRLFPPMTLSRKDRI